MKRRFDVRKLIRRLRDNCAISSKSFFDEVQPEKDPLEKQIKEILENKNSFEALCKLHRYHRGLRNDEAKSLICYYINIMIEVLAIGYKLVGLINNPHSESDGPISSGSLNNFLKRISCAPTTECILPALKILHKVALTPRQCCKVYVYVVKITGSTDEGVMFLRQWIDTCKTARDFNELFDTVLSNKYWIQMEGYFIHLIIRRMKELDLLKGLSFKKPTEPPAGSRRRRYSRAAI